MIILCGRNCFLRPKPPQSFGRNSLASVSNGYGRNSDWPVCPILVTFSVVHYNYRMTHLLAILGWVDFNFGSSTLCLVLPGLMGNWQNWLSSWARGWIIPNQSQPNRGSPGDVSPCNEVRLTRTRKPIPITNPKRKTLTSETKRINFPSSAARSALVG